jgi:hypothetical protein
MLARAVAICFECCGRHRRRIRPNVAVRDYKTLWGQCRTERGGKRTGGLPIPSGAECRISIARRLVLQGTEDEVMTTLCHEVLHTYPRGGRDHGRLFKERAAQVRARYGYDITRVSERAHIARAEPAYEIVCDAGGLAIDRYKRGRIYRIPGRSRGATGGGKLFIREPVRAE